MLAGIATLALAAWHFFAGRQPGVPAPTADIESVAVAAAHVGTQACAQCHAAAPSMARLAARARDAARDRPSRARRLQRREVHLPGRDVDASSGATASTSCAPTAPTASSPTSRSSTPSASRRCSSTWSSCPAGACRRSRSPGTRGRSGRAASAGFTCTRRSASTTRRAALDAAVAELELHVRGLPLHRGAQELRRRHRHLQDDAGPRSRSAARPVTARARRTSSGRERKGDGSGKGLAVRLDERRGVQLGDRRDDRQAEAQRAAHQRARDRGLRAMPRAPRADRRGLRAGRPFLDHYLPSLLTPGCTTPTASSATRCTTGARSCRAGCIAGRDLQRLPRSAQAEAARAGNAVCAQCHAPEKYDAPGAPPSRSRDLQARMRRLPHAADHLHGRRSPPRPQLARAAAGRCVTSACLTRAMSAIRIVMRAGRLRRYAAGSGAMPRLPGFADGFHAAETGQAGARRRWRRSPTMSRNRPLPEHRRSND